MKTAEKGFSCTGIFPMNQEVSSDIDYLPSHMTEIPHIGDLSSMDEFMSLRNNRKKCRCNTAS
jgi:hypothetical protein